MRETYSVGGGWKASGDVGGREPSAVEALVGNVVNGHFEGDDE